MILSYQEIEAALHQRLIHINPIPDKKLWSSTALDLTLNDRIIEWKEIPPPPTGGKPAWPRPKSDNFNVQVMMKDSTYAKTVVIDPNEGYELKPKSFVLGFTREAIKFDTPRRSRPVFDPSETGLT